VSVFRLFFFTGLNAPLYARSNDVGLFATLNINYSVNYWMSKGLERSKIIIGLPTYGHSFHLVNPFNTRLGAPADDIGSVGVLGFTTYSEVCWFQESNFNVRLEYDTETCSPFLSAGLEWISYEDERSLECKANYAKENHFGGIMVFSLNTDDYQLTCDDTYGPNRVGGKRDFPLLRKIHSILFQNATN
jgi:chitinase